MVVTKNSSLRILYTINSSPQYILARSQGAVIIQLIAPEQTPLSTVESSAFYTSICATVSLKSCLTTICRSSPELVQDTNRDFTVYVLDPLESNSAPAPVHISNSKEGRSSAQTAHRSHLQPRGVAVGLGLMSWALAADECDNVSVAGTLYKPGTSQEALEVIFALRETAAMNQSALPAAVKSWGQPASSSMRSSCQPQYKATEKHTTSSTQHDPTTSTLTSRCKEIYTTSSPSAQQSSSSLSPTVATLSTLASIHLRTKSKVKPLRKIPKPANAPMTESDKLMNSSEIYIGPLRKKGRPRTHVPARKPSSDIATAFGSRTTHKQEVIVIDESDSSDGAGKILPCSADNEDQSKSRPDYIPARSAQVKVEQQDKPSLLDILTMFPATSITTEPSSQETALLAALNTIYSSNPHLRMSSSGKEPNSMLISALKQLLSVCANQSTGNRSLLNLLPSAKRESNTDEEVVVLEKENLNPGVFRRRDSLADAKLAVLNSSTSQVLGTSRSSRQGHPRAALGNRSAENSPDKTASANNTIALPLHGSGMRRKRTLSDFMDERESGRSRDRTRHREREHKEAYRKSQIQRKNDVGLNGLRHYPRVFPATQSRSEQPSHSSYYRTGSEPWTSPPRPSKNHALQPPSIEDEADRDRDGSPSCSRRDAKTVKLPRLSVSSPVRSNSQYGQSRKKYIVPEWARTETATQPRLSEEANRALHDAEPNKKKEHMANKYKRMPVAAASVQGKQRGRSAIITSTKPPAFQERGEPPRAAMSVPRTYKGPIAASSDCPLFSTPITLNTSSTADESLSISLKTPFASPKTPVRTRRTSRPTIGAEHNPLFTPLHGSRSARKSGSPLFSPFVNGSVTSSPCSRLNNGISPVRSVSMVKDLTGSVGWGFGKELDKVFEFMEGPLACCSSPTARPDNDDVNDATIPVVNHVKVKSDAEGNNEEDQEALRRKEQWASLPPSSPPPPSSPELMAQEANLFQNDDNIDDLNIPVHSSDAGLEDSGRDTAPSSPKDQHLGCSEEEMIAYANDISYIFGLNGGEKKGNDMDIFSQFTNESTSFSEDASSGENTVPDTTFSNNLEDINLTEFWATFKPLLTDQTSISAQSETNIDFDFGNIDFGDLAAIQAFDHVKLAEEMQALFSG